MRLESWPACGIRRYFNSTAAVSQCKLFGEWFVGFNTASETKRLFFWRIVSELCIRGSLRMVLNDRSIELPLLVKLTICMDVADGMLYLHTRQVFSLFFLLPIVIIFLECRFTVHLPLFIVIWRVIISSSRSQGRVTWSRRLATGVPLGLLHLQVSFHFPVALLFDLLPFKGAKSMTQGVGTACWLSPEVINNAHFSKHSDVYAFGIVLWEVYSYY